MSFTGDATTKPPRVSITNLSTGETREMPFMPEQFTERVVASWAKQNIIGMSHQQLSYSYTENYSIRGLNFFMRAESEKQLDEIHETRKFLMSLAYPQEGSGGIQTVAPPRVLFFWPQLISLTCIIASPQIQHLKFHRQGKSSTMRASFDIEEVRDARITSGRVRIAGTQRSAGSAGGSSDAT